MTDERRRAHPLAKTITMGGRDLEGALNRLFIHRQLTGEEIPLELAEREIRALGGRTNSAWSRFARCQDTQRMSAKPAASHAL